MKKEVPVFRKSPAAPAQPTAAATANFLDSSALVTREPAGAGSSSDAGSDETSVYKTVNAKLNRRRYTNLKLLSAVTGKSMQDYLVEMVDELIERNKDLLANIKPR